MKFRKFYGTKGQIGGDSGYSFENDATGKTTRTLELSGDDTVEHRDLSLKFYKGH
jgi:hypothetical protein